MDCLCATCASMGREMVCAKNNDENAAIFAKLTEVSSKCDDALQDDAGACSGDSGAWLGLKTLGPSNIIYLDLAGPLLRR